MVDSFNDSELKASPRQSSASISFSTHGTFPMDYSSEIDNDENSLLQLPISPVSQSQEEEEEMKEREDNVENEERSISLLEADNLLREIESSEGMLVPSESTTLPDVHVPNELSISKTSQTSHCNEKNANGQSPLSISSSNCFLDGMKLLVERGANINLQDAFGRSPLHLVCENADSDNHHDSLDYLLQNGANPCIQDLQGRTPLHIAANVGCVDCINKLMESCEDSTSSVDSTSSIIQFGNDKSFYQSMQEMTVAASAATNTGKESWHDSGYFTARGNAWTKSKYYPSNKIEEEIDFSQSTLRSESDSLSQQDSNAGVELASTRWNTALELILRLALYLIDFFLSTLRNHVVTKAPPKNGSPGKQEERSCLSFKEPPAHVKEAMDRFKQQQDMQN